MIDSVNILVDSELLTIPEQLKGKIKKVGKINHEPILYGDVNLLKINDLYYMLSSKQVYRYKGLTKVTTEGKSGPEIVNKYSFEYVSNDPTEFRISDQELNKIRYIGYLFNKKIYTGDPNLIKENNLYYSDDIPMINKVNSIPQIGAVSLKSKTMSPTKVDTYISDFQKIYKDGAFKVAFSKDDISISEASTSQTEYTFDPNLIIEIPIHIENQTDYDIQGVRLTIINTQTGDQGTIPLKVIPKGESVYTYSFHPDIGEYELQLKLESEIVESTYSMEPFSVIVNV